ncbi:unnamed protein product [Bursaphelenchus okinawaensis]|uniref:receptor protein-tyrosine kinase n=1 Tax=Bursaphelenchus okinawaensis TaxID=465554 RepID=A0A811L600_9BILA|nr:unnamed protein product [Bursaphelenchus okinawaensis]CAG9118181.1 unnamed protein product [Bursaphelenchus okinawaensis]
MSKLSLLFLLSYLVTFTEQCQRTLYVVPFYMTTSLPEEHEFFQNFLSKCSQRASEENSETEMVYMRVEEPNIVEKCIVGKECNDKIKDFVPDLESMTVLPYKDYNFVNYFKTHLKDNDCLKYSKVIFITNVRCLHMDRYKDFNSLVMEMNSTLLELMSEYELKFHLMWINFNYLSPVDNRDCEMGHLAKPYDTKLSISHSRQSGMMLYDYVHVCEQYDNDLHGSVNVWLIIGLTVLGVVILCLICFGILRYCDFPGKNMLRVSFKAHDQAEWNNYANFDFKKNHWEIRPSQLVLNKNKILGSGGFATVYLGSYCKDVSINGSEKSSKRQVFVKQEQKVAIKEVNENADDNSRAEFWNEINVMKKLNEHQHIVRMMGCVSDPISPILVLEYCELGDLHGLLQAKTHNLTLKDLMSIAWQIVDAMSYVVMKEIIHRDLAARNVLLSKPLTAKISDFGLAINASPETKASSTKLPIKWTALEALHGTFSEKSDVWSFGVLLYEIYSDAADPYPNIPGESLLGHLEKGTRPDIPEKTPENIIPIMTSCWEEKPEDRPNFEKLHEKFTEVLDNTQQVYGYIDFQSED